MPLVVVLRNTSWRVLVCFHPSKNQLPGCSMKAAGRVLCIIFVGPGPTHSFFFLESNEFYDSSLVPLAPQQLSFCFFKFLSITFNSKILCKKKQKGFLYMLPKNWSWVWVCWGNLWLTFLGFTGKNWGGGGAVEPYKVLNIGFLTKRSIPVGSTERLPKFFDQNQKQAFQTFPCKMIFPKGGVEHLGFLQKQT